MSSQAQIDANRANAQLSTGPKSPEGISNTRHNATKHGLTGKQIVVNGEDPAEYDALRAELAAVIAPANEREAMLVEEVAQNWWRLQRARRIETQVLAKLGEVECIIDPEAAKAHQRITRYINSIERSWHRACSELDKLQAARKEVQMAPRAPFRRNAIATHHSQLASPIGSVSSNLQLVPQHSPLATG